MSNTYTIRARREEGWWIATVDEVPGLNHQTKRLDQLEEWTRSGLELFPEIEPHPETAQIRIVVEPAFDIAKKAVQANKEAKDAQDKASSLMRRAARELSAANLPYRDIGTILGVSFQRAQKLATSRASMNTPPARE